MKHEVKRRTSRYSSTIATALHAAALHDHLSCVELLLNHGASIDFTDENCTTALHIAALNGRRGTIALLIRRGANVNAVTRVRCSSCPGRGWPY